MEKATALLLAAVTFGLGIIVGVGLADRQVGFSFWTIVAFLATGFTEVALLSSDKLRGIMHSELSGRFEQERVRMEASRHLRAAFFRGATTIGVLIVVGFVSIGREIVPLPIALLVVGLVVILYLSMSHVLARVEADCERDYLLRAGVVAKRRP